MIKGKNLVLSRIGVVLIFIDLWNIILEKR